MPLIRYEPAKANRSEPSNLPLLTNTLYRPVIAQPEAQPSGELAQPTFRRTVLMPIATTAVVSDDNRQPCHMIVRLIRMYDCR